MSPIAAPHTSNWDNYAVKEKPLIEALKQKYPVKDIEQMVHEIGLQYCISNHIKKIEEMTLQVFGKVKKTIYDSQLIFDMCMGAGDAEVLDCKAKKKGLSTTILPCDEQLIEKLDQIKQLTHRSRVYLIAHGAAELNYVCGEPGANKICATLESFARVFLQVPAIKKPPINNERLKLSLVVCNGATGGNSSALQLSRILFRLGIDIEVVARVGKVLVDPDKGEKRVDDIHHKKNSKYSFITTQVGTFTRLIT